MNEVNPKKINLSAIKNTNFNNNSPEDDSLDDDNSENKITPNNDTSGGVKISLNSIKTTGNKDKSIDNKDKSIDNKTKENGDIDLSKKIKNKDTISNNKDEKKKKHEDTYNMYLGNEARPKINDIKVDSIKDKHIEEEKKKEKIYEDIKKSEEKKNIKTDKTKIEDKQNENTPNIKTNIDDIESDKKIKVDNNKKGLKDDILTPEDNKDLFGNYTSSFENEKQKRKEPKNEISNKKSTTKEIKEKSDEEKANKLKKLEETKQFENKIFIIKDKLTSISKASLGISAVIIGLFVSYQYVNLGKLEEYKASILEKTNIEHVGIELKNRKIIENIKSISNENKYRYNISTNIKDVGGYQFEIEKITEGNSKYYKLNGIRYRTIEDVNISINKKIESLKKEKIVNTLKEFLKR